MIIQYTTGKWDEHRMFLFSIVKNGEVFRRDSSKGFLRNFDRGYDYNLVVDK